jgi:hypothetical protein
MLAFAVGAPQIGWGGHAADCSREVETEQLQPFAGHIHIPV